MFWRLNDNIKMLLMKYFSKITIGLVLCMGVITSCKDDDETTIDGITVDKEEITIGAEGGT